MCSVAIVPMCEEVITEMYNLMNYQTILSEEATQYTRSNAFFKCGHDQLTESIVLYSIGLRFTNCTTADVYLSDIFLAHYGNLGIKQLIVNF